MRQALITVVFFSVVCTAFCQTELKLPVIITGPAAFQMSDLECSVDSKAARIIGIEPLKDRRLQYMLLSDASGSGQNNWPKGTAQQAALEELFLSTVIQKNSDVGTLINFNDETYIDVISEPNPSALAKKIDRKGRGGSATYDAIMKSGGWFAKQPGLVNARKVLFMFTDGDHDNASHYKVHEVIENLQNGAIPLFVFMPNSPANFKSSLPYREIAEKSGGKVYFLPVDRIENSFYDAIRADLANGFLLTLSVPPDISKGAKTLKISSERNPGIRVSSPSEIYIPKNK